MAVFGILMLVAAGSAVLFRRRSLGTRMRVVLSVGAVLLLAGHFVRENGVTPGAVVLTVLAVVVLGSGILFLRRV